MLILFDREGLESALPKVSARLMVFVVTPNVRGAKPLHPVAEIAVAVRPKHQVKVVGHQATTEHAHGHFDGGVRDGFHESLDTNLRILTRPLTGLGSPFLARLYNSP
jgi:hypothetical protein